MVRKLNSLHPIMALFYWDIRNNFRLAVITQDGRNILFGRIILLLGILGVIMGFTYWGALEFRAWAEEAGIIDAIGALYYKLGFSFLAIGGLLISAGLLIGSVLVEEERDMCLRSLPITERDFSFYKGFDSLVGAFCFTLLAGILFLVFGKVVWRADPLDFFSGGLVILPVIISFVILGNLLMSLVAICISPQQRKRILSGMAIFIGALPIVAVLYFDYFWVGDIETLFARFLDILTNPYIPTAWGIELFFLVQEKGWLAREPLMRLAWLIGLGLAGGVALHQVCSLTYREEGAKETRIETRQIRRESRLLSLITRLPLDSSTKAFLKRDLILYFRNRSELVQAVITIGVFSTLALGGEGPVGFLYLLYLLPELIVPGYLHSSLKTEGSSMDYIKMLMEKGKFIAAKVVATFLMILVLCLIMVFASFAFFPALEWDFVSIIVRMLIVSLAVLQATLLGMVYGEQILISGKKNLDQTIGYFCLGVLMAVGWLGIDLFFINPQMLPGWTGAVLPHLPLIIFGGIISYSIFRLRKFARAIEDI